MTYDELTVQLDRLFKAWESETYRDCMLPGLGTNTCNDLLTLIRTIWNENTYLRRTNHELGDIERAIIRTALELLAELEAAKHDLERQVELNTNLTIENEQVVAQRDKWIEAALHQQQKFDLAMQNLRANNEAFAAMRNDLNELFPIQSDEADLLEGPEMSVACAAIIEAARTWVTESQVNHPYEDWRAAINFAIETDEPQAFLKCWNEGDWQVLDDEWPEWGEMIRARNAGGKDAE